MTTENTALALPDEGQFQKAMQAINRFQQVVHANMVKDQDYGVIPGTTKPTLLKPGAEKISKLLGLADQYDIIDKTEDWQRPFFRYLVKCSLVHLASQNVVSEGLGECNSMEAKYRWRWVFQSDLPEGADKDRLPQRSIQTKRGPATQYRVENDDIYTQVNTLIKMAKKRALVDAALSAGRLSNVFTQDIEDMAPGGEQSGQEKPIVAKQGHWCVTHNVAFFKKGKMRGYAHPIEGSGDPPKWCDEPTKAEPGHKCIDCGCSPCICLGPPPEEEIPPDVVNPAAVAVDSTAKVDDQPKAKDISEEQFRLAVDKLKWSGPRVAEAVAKCKQQGIRFDVALTKVMEAEAKA